MRNTYMRNTFGSFVYFLSQMTHHGLFYIYYLTIFTLYNLKKEFTSREQLE